MAVTKIKPIKSTLKKALDYIQNPNKTDGKMLVSSFGCSYETADIKFAFTFSLEIPAFRLQRFRRGFLDASKFSVRFVLRYNTAIRGKF